MYRSFLVTILSAILLGPICRAGSGIIGRASQLEESGKFSEAAALLREALRTGGGEEVRILTFELDRLRRIRLDFPLSKEDLFRQLKESVKDLSPQEFDTWVREGRFDSRIIDDTVWFAGVSRRNLFCRYQDLESRRTPPESDSAVERKTLETAHAIMKEAIRTGTPYVLPKRFTIRMAIEADSGAVPARSTVRAWLPVPRLFPHQNEFSLRSSSSAVQQLSDELSPIRSVYMEKAAEKGKSTVFTVEYEYRSYGVSFALDPRQVQPYTADDRAVKEFTGEGPHVRFTDKIKELSRSIAGDRKNPLVIARSFHDWISENILYSYSIEYSTIRNISDYCLTKRYGDCGQHALLFITLCRYNGIPARWQSGWYTFPGAKTIHDWAEIFVKPYGWIPVDPDMGIFAMRYFTSLSPEERRLLRDFYFGGLEQYRMAANADHCQGLTPPKHAMRSDTVDFQRGEMEYGEENLYFDKWSYRMEVEEQPE